MNDMTEAQPEEVTGLALLSKTGEALADLQHRLKDRVYEISTVKGMDEAKKDRKELRDLRVSLNKTRLALNSDDQERIRARNQLAGEITAKIEALEDPIDAQIKAEEDKKAEARAEREREAAEKLAAINARIFNIRQMPLNAMGADAAELQQAIDNLVAQDLEDFDDVHLPTAQQAKDEALTHLRRMLDDRTELDARAEELRLQAAEHEERQRQADAEAAERKRIADEEQAERDRLAKAERDRLDAEAAERRRVEQEEADARRAEQDRLDAERREAERVEQERVAAQQAETQRLLDEQAAEQHRKAQEDEEAEATRRADEEAAAAQAASEAAEAAIQAATLVEAATEAHALLIEAGYSDHIVSRKLASALAKEPQA
jgi:colicin import membrane protein